jgi:hypothetical protein
MEKDLEGHNDEESKVGSNDEPVDKKQRVLSPQI